MKHYTDTNLHAGLKTTSPKACDASTRPPSMSSTVNSEPTRGSTQPNQKSLGPRVA